jgi:hypothetical protein
MSSVGRSINLVTGLLSIEGGAVAAFEAGAGSSAAVAEVSPSSSFALPLPLSLGLGILRPSSIQWRSSFLLTRKLFSCESTAHGQLPLAKIKISMETHVLFDNVPDAVDRSLRLASLLEIGLDNSLPATPINSSTRAKGISSERRDKLFPELLDEYTVPSIELFDLGEREWGRDGVGRFGSIEIRHRRPSRVDEHIYRSQPALAFP